MFIAPIVEESSSPLQWRYRRRCRSCRIKSMLCREHNVWRDRFTALCLKIRFRLWQLISEIVTLISSFISFFYSYQRPYIAHVSDLNFFQISQKNSLSVSATSWICVTTSTVAVTYDADVIIYRLPGFIKYCSSRDDLKIYLSFQTSFASDVCPRILSFLFEGPSFSVIKMMKLHGIPNSLTNTRYVYVLV